MRLGAGTSSAGARGAGARLLCISGIGPKRPACFLVEAEGRRIVLDLGVGPDPGRRPDVSGVGPVDAVVLSHAHVDHAGGMDLLAALGDPPVHATALVLDLVKPYPGQQSRGRPSSAVLSPTGEAEIAGIPVRTGRAGHAPGGVWIHLGVGGGLLYMGDHSVESDLYAFDDPPPAATLVLDASYGTYDEPQARCRAEIEPFLAAGALFPVPAGGRGPEMAAWAAGLGLGVAIDAAVEDMARRLAGPESAYLRPAAAQALARLHAGLTAPGDPGRPTFAAKPNADGGAAAALARDWAARPGRPPILFTGHVAEGSPAAELMACGRAEFRRWNVHPRLSDNVALVRAVGARRVIPAFGATVHGPAWAEAFAPAEVTFGPEVLL
ncbi:MBL fold metallo-hydrolase [Arenibaculum pallidiluteum]|uniref:MBL fold metallo-hydrolase n=1 Tax=Arenibaculum pallidiluteum TaxID=2812559 RepID=UPI001A95A263|nr:MBL fold metallo-hydrolase [Arenibaculum pallidiluteum]